jgi:hypothetical protein
MKLAEALAERHDLLTQIEELQRVMEVSARWQEGSDPADNATETLDAIIRMRSEAAVLITRINLTNMQARVSEDSSDTIMSMLARRDAAQAHVKYCQGLLTAAGGGRNRGMYRQLRSELPDVTNVDIPGLRARLAGYASAARELDNTIQQLNWATELVAAP